MSDPANSAKPILLGATQILPPLATALTPAAHHLTAFCHPPTTLDIHRLSIQTRTGQRTSSLTASKPTGRNGTGDFVSSWTSAVLAPTSMPVARFHAPMRPCTLVQHTAGRSAIARFAPFHTLSGTSDSIDLAPGDHRQLEHHRDK